MTIGLPGKNGVRTSDLNEAQEIIDVFYKHGHREIDTARIYAEGSTESVCVLIRFLSCLVEYSVWLCSMLPNSISRIPLSTPSAQQFHI